jgi:hypothetical protein
MKKIITIIACALIIGILNSCKYEELPPKTDNASSNYILPKGEIPTAEEREIVNNIKNEYIQSTNN